MSNAITQTISIKPSKGLINVATHVYIGSKDEEGKISCFIPGFNIYYSVSKKEEISMRGRMLTQFFLDNFFIHNKGNAASLLNAELTKRGFKSTNYGKNALQKFGKNKVVKAIFSNKSEIPSEFKEVKMHKFDLQAMAV
jgi:hypothetical protein